MYMPYETPSISFILEPIAAPNIIKYKEVVIIGDTNTLKNSSFCSLYFMKINCYYAL